ncbi:Rad1-domain-containing protein, partial [Fistulina hepatica ATCC 64428]
ILKASMPDVRPFATLLRGVYFESQVHVTVTLMRTGLTVSAEAASGSVTGTAYVFPRIFEEYAFRPEQDDTALRDGDGEDEDAESETTVVFKVRLSTVLECLDIFGTASGVPPPPSHKRWRKLDRGDSDPEDEATRRRKVGKGLRHYLGGEKRTSMRMSYQGTGYPLTMLLAEDASGPITTCEITTFEADDCLVLPFEDEATDFEGKWLGVFSYDTSDRNVQSSWLADALSEVDSTCKIITFISGPPATDTNGPQRTSASLLKLEATGNQGSIELEYPNDREVLETFECNADVNFKQVFSPSRPYAFFSIAYTMKALQSSTKTSLRITDDGLLSMQFLMPSRTAKGGQSEAFVEFRVRGSRCLPFIHGS